MRLSSQVEGRIDSVCSLTETEMGFRNITAASNVCTQALAVPEIVLVKAEVYLTCKNMAILIPNPDAAVIIWQIKKK